jgi:curved DNA-binding protein CbpA
VSQKNRAKSVATPTADPYRVLGIEREAAEAEIKRAYFQLVRQFPPEREPEKFQEIRAAYESLRDAGQRAEVSLFLLQPPLPLQKRRSPSYDLDVHPEDLLTLMIDAVASPMQVDFLKPPS